MGGDTPGIRFRLMVMGSMSLSCMVDVYNSHVMGKVILIGACWLLLAMPAFAQETPGGAQPKGTEGTSEKVHSYEIVSIRQNKTVNGAAGMRSLPDGFEWTNIPFESLVRGTYGIIMDSQVSGLPDWARRENYDIVAKVDADTAERWKKLSPQERGKEELPMMKSILADRCQFKAHQEIKELPVYDLVIAGGGLKMKEAPANETPTETMSGDQMTVHAMAIYTIVLAFPYTVGRVIVDKTGLGDKKFDFELKWTPNDRPSADDVAPSLLTALEEQLGLKLVPARGPVETLIIEHLERPSPN
jgi:uncharacterized protein (TIGR03435 family)